MESLDSIVVKYTCTRVRNLSDIIEEMEMFNLDDRITKQPGESKRLI